MGHKGARRPALERSTHFIDRRPKENAAVTLGCNSDEPDSGEDEQRSNSIKRAKDLAKMLAGCVVQKKKEGAQW